MLSLIEREAVDKRKWIDKEQMSDIIVIAESTPGPIAINSATFVGNKVGGFLGAVCATLGVVLPGLVIITVIYRFSYLITDNYWVSAAFKGIRCSVTVLILNAVIKFVKPSLHSFISVSIAVCAFAVATFTSIPVIYVIAFAGAAGVVFALIKKHNVKGSKTSDNCKDAENKAIMSNIVPDNGIKKGAIADKSDSDAEKGSNDDGSNKEGL